MVPSLPEHDQGRTFVDVELPRRGTSLSFVVNGSIGGDAPDVWRFSFDGVGGFVVPKNVGGVPSKPGRFSCPRRRRSPTAENDGVVVALKDGRALLGCVEPDSRFARVFVVDDASFHVVAEDEDSAVVVSGGRIIIDHALVPGVHSRTEVGADRTPVKRCARDKSALTEGARAIVDGGPVGEVRNDVLAAALFGDKRARAALENRGEAPGPADQQAGYEPWRLWTLQWEWSACRQNQNHLK